MQDLVVGGKAPRQVLGVIPWGTLDGSMEHLPVLSLAVVPWPGNYTKTYNDAVCDYPVRHTRHLLLSVIMSHGQIVLT